MVIPDRHPRLVRCAGVELLRPLGERAFLAVLPNGHEIAAVLTRRVRATVGDLAVGMRVTVDLAPSDFTQARVVSVDEPPHLIASL
jgi:translation initiation factor IF-1